LTEAQVVDRSPIINDPYREPQQYWHFAEGKLPEVMPGRRTAGYLPPGGEDGQLTITADLVPLPVVNDLRDRVRAWRADGYPGVTPVTRDLLDRWFDEDREPGLRPFFAQQEAFETIVFLTEAPPDRRVGIDIPRVEAYERWAVKMATGTGKTLVMAMTIAWSTLNKAISRGDTRFADAVLVVCPNLTVKERLADLDPHRSVSEYKSFGLIPPNLSALMGQGRVMVTNWHALAPETDPRRSVLRRGAESDAAFCRRVIEPFIGKKRRILVINDEAHHAYRHHVDGNLRGEEAEEAERATVWIDGLARIHRDREVLRCLDFSATPMYVPGSGHSPWTPFPWVISDFALVDAIESGLVKIPKIPTDDNAGAAVPKYRNLWQHVKANLPRAKDEPDAGNPLVDYLTQVDGPLKQLAGKWQETFELWQTAKRRIPPAMIIVCNDTRMAEVLDAHIGAKGEAGPELQNPAGAGSSRTVRIDSKLLREAEARDDAGRRNDAEEQLRKIVASVGKEGEPGESVRCLISVGMLSEGWDARNVTQILGLRAFTSQLLCEQVVGRGLRRSTYDDLSQPEYVDVYGVPFQLLPFAKATPARVIEPPHTTSVIAIRERAAQFSITFPRVVSIVNDVGMTLEVDWDSIADLAVSAEHDPTRTEVSDLGFGSSEEQTHEPMWRSYRRQKLLFDVGARLIKGQSDRRLDMLFPQAIAAVNRFVETKVVYGRDADERELDNELYKSEITNRLRTALRPPASGQERLLPVLDEFEPEGSTARVAFSTAKPTEPTTKSHVNFVVCDSELERRMAQALESDSRVLAYVKNDHLFFEIPYRYLGRTLRYIPDFVVRLADDRMVILEGKGRELLKDTAKETAAGRWIDAVNADGRWGTWSHAVIYHEDEVAPALEGALEAPVAVTGPS
jgi:type III restriction enzyme